VFKSSTSDNTLQTSALQLWMLQNLGWSSFLAVECQDKKHEVIINWLLKKSFTWKKISSIKKSGVSFLVLCSTINVVFQRCLDISHKDCFVLYTEYNFPDKWGTFPFHPFFSNPFFFSLEFLGKYNKCTWSLVSVQKY